MIIQSLQTTIQSTFQQVRQYSISKILKTTACVTFVALGAIYRFNDHSRIEDCLSVDCPDINISNIHPREKDVVDTIFKTNHKFMSMFSSFKWEESQKYLRFDINGPKKKFFYAAAESDYNGALAPHLAYHLLRDFSSDLDFRYEVIRKFKHLCRSIRNGALTGDIKGLVIDAHGSEDGILLDKSPWTTFLDQYIDASSDFAECFSHLHPNANIFLFSCSTGKPKKRFFDLIVEKITGIERKEDPFNNIAQIISDKAKRVVFAPTDEVTSFYTEYISKDGSSVYHPLDLFIRSEGQPIFVNPLSSFFQPNLYQAFRPRFKKCSPTVNKEKLTENEISIEAAIKTDLIGKYRLHKDSPFMKEYFQHCKDDPRENVLVFSASDDDKSPYPKNFIEIFSRLADEKDFSFHQIKSPEKACYVINSAAQQGKVSGVIFIGTKGSKGLLLSKDERGAEKQIDLSMNFKKCFSGVDKNGKIIFIGGSLGEDGENENNIPQRVANMADRVVEAATCPVFLGSIELRSTSPVTLYHPSHSFVGKLAWRCKENNKNLFKRFFPKS